MEGVTSTLYAGRYLAESVEILRRLDERAIERMVDALAALRDGGGRLYFLGVGGSASHASHATGDFRKIAGFEAYCATDNVTEMTARINDEGWDTVFAQYLAANRLSARDGVFVLSVGGGDVERRISANLVYAISLAKQAGATVFGIVGRDGGHTALAADHCIIVPVVNPESVTAHTESFQPLLWHLMVSHPRLRRATMKWESEAGAPAQDATPRNA